MPVVQVFGLAVRVEPTMETPEMLGVATVATRAVAADVAVTVAKPACLPVTLTVMRLSRWVDVGRKV